MFSYRGSGKCVGSYISTSKYLELPFRIEKTNLRKDVAFSNKVSDDEIINTIANSNISRIQTKEMPTATDIFILNKIFRLNPKIAFRYFGVYCQKQVDISFILKLTHLKILLLDINVDIKNIEVVQQLNLECLELDCFNVKDYSFLKNVKPSIKKINVNLENKSYKMDINYILHFKDLEELIIRNVNKGLDKLVEFKKLNSLYLRSISIKDYSFLRRMNVKKLYLSFQNPNYFDTFGINSSIEEISLWMNRNLTDLSFLLQFPNLKRIIISNQKNIKIIPDLTKLKKLEEVYFLYRNVDEVKSYCDSNVKVYSSYNPADIY